MKSTLGNVAYWRAVEDCLTQLHGYDAPDAARLLEQHRQRLAAKVLADVGQPLRRPEPFDVACDLAGVTLSRTAHSTAYRTIVSGLPPSSVEVAGGGRSVRVDGAALSDSDAPRSGSAGRYSVTLLIGGPGAGKGTQADNIHKTLGIPAVSTGDLLRQHCRDGSKVGKVARGYMDAGELVPDNLVVQMVLDRLEQPDASSGVLLDGFPRTLTQAELLDGALTARRGRVETALFLNVPERVLLRRLSGRRLCPHCLGVFHVDLHAEAAAGHCPACGADLVQRSDDYPEAVAHRIESFLTRTTRVLQHYRAQGNLFEVDGDQPVARIWADVQTILMRGAAAAAGVSDFPDMSGGCLA